MDDFPETTFGNLRKEEHYRRQKLNLKLAFIKQMEQIKIKAADEKGYCTSPTWPSVSSINPDGIDTSCGNGSPFLQVSSIDSEVVASSNNLRKVLLLKSHDNRKPTATSSVKHFPINDSDKDRAIMPPPSMSNLKFCTKKQSSTALRHSPQNQQSIRREMDNEVNFLKTLSCGSSIDYQKTNSSVLKSDDQDKDRIKVFNRWRVLLNDKHQLIIKGTLQCGKVARSKPVLQKISSNKILSIYKHIYILDGNIVDDRYELPDYVRGKFNNGFPDDWENVYQVWRHYVAGGSKDTFRWPTRITDDDDDLISEVTDFINLNKKQNPYEKQVFTSKSISNSQSTSGYCSRISSESNQNLELYEKEKFVTANVQTDIEKQTNKKDDKNVVENKNNSNCNVENNIGNNAEESHNDVMNTNSRNSNSVHKGFLTQILRDDKLRIILSNMSDEHCPPEYIDKFVDLIDCLRYLISFKASSNKEVIKNQNPTLPENEIQVCKNCNNTASLSETQETNPNEESNNTQNKNKCIDNPQHSELNENCKKQSMILKSSNQIASESSDSDTYMGVPNMSLDGLIKSNALRFRRDRNRKTRSSDRKSINQDDQTKEKITPKHEPQNYYDSSVSITEDEYERRQQSIREKNKNLRDGNQQDNVANEKPRNKPIVKSCEPVNFDIKLKYPSKIKIPVNLKESNLKRNYGNRDGINNGYNEEKVDEELLKHPFLSYDSGDFRNEEKENLRAQLPLRNSNSNESEKKYVAVAQKKENYRRTATDQNKLEQMKDLSDHVKEKTASFGSQENPKKLISWTPVVCSDKLKKKNILKFEGILLNEARHILHKKFITDPIFCRHSANLVETIKNEYFLLIGELNNTKHVVPKGLVKQCRTGCPSKIQEFCEEWIELISEVSEKTSNNNNNSTNIEDSSISLNEKQTSSYRNGERTREIETIPKNVSVQESNSKSRISSEHQAKKSMLEINAKNMQDSTKSVLSESSSSPGPRIRIQRKRLAQQLQYASSSGSDSDVKQHQKHFRKPSGPLRGNAGNSQSKPIDQQIKVGIQTETNYNLKLRKRQRFEDRKLLIKNTNKRDLRASTKAQSEVIVLYEKDQEHQDVLSDDVASLVTQ